MTVSVDIPLEGVPEGLRRATQLVLELVNYGTVHHMQREAGPSTTLLFESPLPGSWELTVFDEVQPPYVRLRLLAAGTAWAEVELTAAGDVVDLFIARLGDGPPNLDVPSTLALEVPPSEVVGIVEDQLEMLRRDLKLTLEAVA